MNFNLLLRFPLFTENIPWRSEQVPNFNETTETTGTKENTKNMTRDKTKLPSLEDEDTNREKIYSNKYCLDIQTL